MTKASQSEFVRMTMTNESAEAGGHQNSICVEGAEPPNYQVLQNEVRSTNDEIHG